MQFAWHDKESRSTLLFNSFHLGLGERNRAVNDQGAIVQADDRHPSLQRCEWHMQFTGDCPQPVVQLCERAVRHHSPFVQNFGHDSLLFVLNPCSRLNELIEAIKTSAADTSAIVRNPYVE